MGPEMHLETSSHVKAWWHIDLAVRLEHAASNVFVLTFQLWSEIARAPSPCRDC